MRKAEGRRPAELFSWRLSRRGGAQAECRMEPKKTGHYSQIWRGIFKLRAAATPLHSPQESTFATRSSPVPHRQQDR
jgi:hypothetical protein